MDDKWYRNLSFGLTLDEFHLIPRHPSWKYEYWDGRMRLSPRPGRADAVLRIRSISAPPAVPRSVVIHPIDEKDWESLPGLCAAAFRGVVPWAALSDEECLDAARECMDGARGGSDGPLIPAASHVARDDEGLAGALLVTRYPHGRFGGCDEWPQRLGADPAAVEASEEWPHLSWVFVRPIRSQRGIGTALLAAAAGALESLGSTYLTSCLLPGNVPSLLWHWRNGFQLLERLWSPRTILQ